ncbi:MAG: hypothetical protein JNM24_08470 [Bdellovibrionaceae bacterium]|nr:hypothetical protein [Pseudobdellovibrionaceae bacterium]
MRKFVFLILVLSIVFYFVWSFINTRPGEQRVKFIPADKECFSEAADGSRYCIYRARQGTNGSVFYYLHGRNLDEHSWNDDTYYTALVQKYWETHGHKPPIVVSISYGPIWLLTPKNGAEKSGLLETFVSRLIPKIENRLGFTPRSRGLVGESMGGLNSLIVGLNRPELFQRVASLCPPVYHISPFDPWSAIWNEIKTTGAEPKTIAGIILLGKKYVSNTAEWNAMSPLELIKNFSLNHRVALYLSAPLYDKYGIFEGVEKMAYIGRERGLNLVWQPLYGGHCAVDTNSVAEFMMNE